MFHGVDLTTFHLSIYTTSQSIFPGSHPQKRNPEVQQEGRKRQSRGTSTPVQAAPDPSTSELCDITPVSSFTSERKLMVSRLKNGSFNTQSWPHFVQGQESLPGVAHSDVSTSPNLRLPKDLPKLENFLVTSRWHGHVAFEEVPPPQPSPILVGRNIEQTHQT